MNPEPRFAAGAAVRVAEGPAEAHCRTPLYLRGKPGVVEREVGLYLDPTRLAFLKPGLPKRRLYRVRFEQRTLWPDYAVPTDTLYADIYEHWLLPAGAPEKV